VHQARHVQGDGADGSGGRGYGFDISTGYSQPRGSFFEIGSTFGHTGFTGTGLWITPARHRAWTLLTNRVHPSRHADSGIAELRRRGCICPPEFPRHVTLPSNFTKKFDSAGRLQLA
jgi:CubicO group peptidase (beta-lactamase class C family)